MADDRTKDPRDVLAGRNLAILRGDMTQATLAAKMRDLGWKWSQATVWAVEKGDRPFRLAEAQDVLGLLGRTGVESALLRDTSLTQINAAARKVLEAWETAVDAIVAFREAQVGLSFAYSSAREEGADLRNGDLLPVEHWLSPDMLEQMIKAADGRWLKDEGLDPDDPSVGGIFQGLDSPVWERVSPEEASGGAEESQI